MISLNLEKTSMRPLYVQIFEQIADKINNGNLKAGSKLPSQRKFAKYFGISVNTVVNAYNMLIQYEYISSENKRGYYVKKVIEKDARLSEKRWQSDVLCTYNFSKNGVDLKMNGEFKKTIRQIAKITTDQQFNYPDYIGTYELRKQICLMLGKYYEINCQPTQIIVGAGVNYLLDLLIKVIGKDKVYGLENPSAYKISSFMQLSGYNVNYLNVDRDGIIPNALEDFEADVLFLMSYHHYPIGYTLTQAQKKEILNWSKKDRYIIECGYDMEFLYSSQGKPLFSMTEDKNVIFINDFSKSIAPDINIAYLILPESLVKKWQSLYLNFHSYSSKFEQQFVSEVIKNGSYYRNIKRLKKNYAIKKQCLITAIKNHTLGNMIEIKNENAGTFLIIEPKIECDAKTLIEKCHNAGVKLSWIENAKIKPNPYICSKTYVLGYGGLSEKEIQEGIVVLLDTWEKLVKQD